MVLRKIGAWVGCLGVLATVLCLQACGPGEKNPVSGKEELSSVNIPTVRVEYHTLKDADKYAAYEKGKPAVMDTEYKNGERVVAIYNVVQFGAKGDGVTDDGSAFDQALAAASKDGGGTVFVPDGTYYIHRSLTIREGVTLRGTWEDPDSRGKGTLIITDHEALGRAGVPFITMSNSTAVKNIAIYYKNQSFRTPKALSPTFNMVTSVNGVTLDHIMLYNSYFGICMGNNGSQVTALDHIYGTPMNTGILVDFAPDINRIMNIHFSPKYYAECGFEGAPRNEEDVTALRDSMLKDSTGIISERIDWHCIYNINLEGYKVGVHFRKSSQDNGPDWTGPPSGYLYGFDIRGGEIGLLIDQVMYAGFQISNGKIEASAGGEPTAIRLTEKFCTSIFLNNIEVTGKPKHILRSSGTGNVNIVGCSFEDWGYCGGKYAVEIEGGVAAVEYCDFKADKPAFKVWEDVACAGFLSNTLTGDGQLDVSALPASRVIVGQNSADMPREPAVMHKEIEKIPAAANDSLFIAADYGVNPSSEDCTEALQSALDAAGANGGGTVYVQPGRYVFKGTLTVPSGVELRGVFDTLTHTGYHVGTLFNVKNGKGEADGTPFISLEEGAGIRGVNFYYPDQNLWENYVAYPWTIRSLGKGCWVQNVILINSYCGVDFGTNPSDGHFVNYLAGQTISKGIFIGNNSGEGWLQNTQFVTHYIHSSDVPNRPSLAGGDFDAKWERLRWSLMKQNDYFILGYNEQEHMFNNMSFGSRYALHFIEQEGKGTNATIISQYTDSTTVALKIDKAGKLNFYNSWLCIAFSHDPRKYIEMEKDCGAMVNMFTSGGHGYPTLGYEVRGGELNLMQSSIFDPGEPAFLVEGGTVRTFACLLHNSTNLHIKQTGGTIDFIGNIVRLPVSFIDLETDFIEIDGDENAIHLSNNLATNVKYW